MDETKYSFQWRYVILPFAVLLISIILTAIFFGMTPDEVAYRFNIDGEPTAHMGAFGAVSLFLGIQLAVAFVSFVITRTISAQKFLTDSKDVAIRPDKLLTLMGNILVIPQLVFAYALLDMFIYNANEFHLMPLWLFVAIVLVTSTIIIGVLTLPSLIKVIKSMTKDKN